MSSTPRIALIHALASSVSPINTAFDLLWPEAVRMNLLDDSLSTDLARHGTLDAVMQRRFETLADYAVGTGAQALLFTCSAFGRCIDAVARRHEGLPVLKPNTAMVDEAAGTLAPGEPLGLIASFAPTLASMPAEFPSHVALRTALAAGALNALEAGRPDEHDALVVAAARTLQAQGCTLLALAQFSLSRAAPAVQAATGLEVLTTVESSVRALRRRFDA